MADELPLSHELLSYYRARVAASEDEIAALTTRIDSLDATKEEAYRGRSDLLRRNSEVAELQRALSDSHVYVWEERERCYRLQAENDELKIQEAEDRRKIQCGGSRAAAFSHASGPRSRPRPRPSPAACSLPPPTDPRPGTSSHLWSLSRTT